MFWRSNRRDPVPTPEERVTELLSAYLDGEVTPAERAEVEALLERDAAAREQLAYLRLVAGAFAALGAEVRAPRSFAIPASAAGSTSGSPRAMFQRVEMAFRASAAAAALLFVIVLVNGPTGETPVSTPTIAMPEASSAANAGTGEGGAVEETYLVPGEATGGGAAAPAPEFAPPSGGSAAPDEGEDGGVGVMSTPAEEDPDTAQDAADATISPAGGATLEQAPAGETERSAQGSGVPAPEAPAPGTIIEPATSDGSSGMARGLGALAGLLTVLSVLLAWDRRTASTDRAAGDD